MADETWWREGVLYQIYPRSFADSDGDGIGDLRGILARLDHLEWLGVDGIWLNPTMPSPNDDWGYDVADYTAVHPDLGTLEDLDALVAAAGRAGSACCSTWSPTTPRPPRLVRRRARRPRRAAPRLLRMGRPGPGRRPAEQLALELRRRRLDARRAERPVLPAQLPAEPARPQLVERRGPRRLRRVLRFWYDRGVAGFRIDVCHAIVKDRELRDDPAVTPADHPEIQRRPARQVFSMNRPEVHDVLRRWRALSDATTRDRVLVGETYVLDLDQLMPFYGNGEDELNLAFNFLFVHAPLEAGRLRTVVEGIEAQLPRGRLAGLGRLQPRREAARHALGRRRPGARPRRAADAADAARDPVPLLRRRARAARRPVRPARPRRTRSRAAPATRATTATSAARRCRGATRRAAASPRRRRRRGWRSATSPRTTSPASAPTRPRRCTWCAT